MRQVLLVLLAGMPAAAQFDRLGEQIGQLGKKLPLTEIKLVAEPKEARARPFETLIVQVRAYGKLDDKQIRLRRSGAKLKMRATGGGWISKAFVFQGKDDESFHDESKSSVWNIFAGASGEFVNKDSFLYTAPEKPGKYVVEAELEGKQATLEIDVAADAPSRAFVEKTIFPTEQPSRDPYRPLVEHYAPMLAQETWFQPKSDTPSRFDFDGDWNGDNNWDSLDAGSSQAYVYYAAMETASHWFLIYNVFHARDYSDKCVIGTCHENDNEGLILTIRKDGTTFGRLQAMETLAHNNVYSVAADTALRDGVHRIDGAVEFYQESHPIVFIESGGHGIYGSTLTAHSRYSREKDEFLDGTGITFVYKGVAERPRHANDRLVGYELLSIQEHWWARAKEGAPGDRTFDSFFRYQPVGGRPRIDFTIGGSFWGRKEAANKAKPFWGWHDNATLKRGVLAVGQWGLDPAYAVSRNLRFPVGQEFSLDYVHNPYLGIDKVGTIVLVSGTPVVSAPSAGSSSSPVQPSSTDPAALLAVGLERPASPDPAGALAVDLNVPASGTVEIEAQVDGTIDIYVQRDTLRFEVRGGQAVSREKSVFSSALPGIAVGSCTVAKLSGRGKVSLLEPPSAANGFTAVIRVEDTRGGSDFYRLRLEWKK